MPQPSSEADARIVIDDMLRRAGWDPANKADVLTEIPISEVAVAEEQAPYGGVSVAEPAASVLRRTDYVLLDQQGRPIAVIEAKRKAIEQDLNDSVFNDARLSA